jgi:2-C-methyl-D-erythritol 4-phosphate cytidylyltransferase
LIDGIVETAKEYRAAIPAIPARDTIKIAETGYVVSTPKRESLFMAQTPQVFEFDVYEKALRLSDTVFGTDDSMLVEQSGIAVKIVEGDERNIKITTLFDLKIAEVLLKC